MDRYAEFRSQRGPLKVRVTQIGLRVWSTKILRSWTIFMAIFELSGVNYLRNRLSFINLTSFAKHCLCAIFSSKMILVESLLLLDYMSYDSTKSGKCCWKVVSTKVHLDFMLIRRFCVLISPN